MIYCQMHGRLGNQMFQYAAARCLQNKTKQNITLRFGQVIDANTEGKDGWENSLKYFRTRDYIEDNEKSTIISKMGFFYKLICLVYVFRYKLCGKDINRIYETQRKLMPIFDNFGIWWISNGFFEFKNMKKKDYYLNGAFESELYFSDIREQLISEFTPKEEPIIQNQELYNIIKNNNSVCVSLRHFKLPDGKVHNYDICGKEYYTKAINYMKQCVENPVFIIFSDDIEWARNMLSFFEGNVYYETENNPVWEKLRLMSSCKHFIIPNSTFAWWAQYLGTFEYKRVIGPDRWFNNDFVSPLVQTNWVKINSDGKIV